MRICASTLRSRTNLNVLLPLGLVCISVLLQSCKSSDFQDIFRRCSPECVNFESPVNLDEVEKTFTDVIDTVEVSKKSLTGRWVLLSTNHYVIDQPKERSISDLLFTKSLVLTENDNQVSVSDCYNSETYDIKQNSFSIPSDSNFFSSLYFENEENIEVNLVSNTELEAEWIFVTPSGDERLVEASMYKVSDDDDPGFSLGTIDNAVDIHCYSFMHLFTSGEQLISGQWVPAEIETKEMVLTIDPASGDNYLALGSERVNENVQYAITFDLGIEGSSYECFGKNEILNAADDFLAFEGFYNIKTFDSICNDVHAHELVKKSFSFTAL